MPSTGRSGARCPAREPCRSSTVSRRTSSGPPGTRDCSRDGTEPAGPGSPRRPMRTSPGCTWSRRTRLGHDQGVVSCSRAARTGGLSARATPAGGAALRRRALEGDLWVAGGDAGLLKLAGKGRKLEVVKPNLDAGSFDTRAEFLMSCMGNSPGPATERPSSPGGGRTSSSSGRTLHPSGRTEQGARMGFTSEVDARVLASDPLVTLARVELGMTLYLDEPIHGRARARPARWRSSSGGHRPSCAAGTPPRTSRCGRRPAPRRRPTGWRTSG